MKSNRESRVGAVQMCVHATCAAAVLLGVTGIGSVGAQTSKPATELLARRSTLQPQTRVASSGAEPIHLVSRDSDKRMEGDVYAELAQPFARVSTVLRSADAVCDVLFLHLNIRSCRASMGSASPLLTLVAGPKHAAIGTTYNLTYAMQLGVVTDDYLSVVLTAASGPLSTSDYRITFEAAPLDGQRTFLHFGYAYRYGGLAKAAMGIYLATAGRSKIGFTTVGTGADGQPQYVQGERGSVERNVMRNLLALQAYTGVTSGTPQAQTDARLRAWFALTERHAAQLHELDLETYLQEKRADLALMATPMK